MILVYVPDHANQTLPQECILTLDLPRTATGRRGYIDPSNPHAANHIIIGNLGNEEILLVACDDGDVIGFTVRSICLARQLNAEGDEKRGCGQEAFFLENVGLSAWGLAVHEEARLIAVSANTTEITVFAFALGYASSSESDVERNDDMAYIETLQGNSDWNPVEQPYETEQRSSRNLIIHLRKHYENVPNISFCNGDADPDGRLLVSTDIAGNTLIWDIWKQQPVQLLSPGGSRRPNRGRRDGACERNTPLKSLS